MYNTTLCITSSSWYHPHLSRRRIARRAVIWRPWTGRWCRRLPRRLTCWGRRWSGRISWRRLGVPWGLGLGTMSTPQPLESCNRRHYPSPCRRGGSIGPGCRCWLPAGWLWRLRLARCITLTACWLFLSIVFKLFFIFILYKIFTFKSRPFLSIN